VERENSLKCKGKDRTGRPKIEPDGVTIRVHVVTCHWISTDESGRHIMKTEGADAKFVLAVGDAEQGHVLILVADSKLNLDQDKFELGVEVRSGAPWVS
jgi:hypothetical protein